MAVLGITGAQLAWNLVFAVGTTLLARALAPNPAPIEGPRLDDLKVTSSAYGAVIAFGYGTARVGGNLIWGLPIREQRNTERVGGKGGGPSQKVTTWSYYFTGAVAVSEGPIEDILRIWADSKLIFDRGGQVEIPPRARDEITGVFTDDWWEAFYGSLEGNVLHTGTTREGWKFRVYLGTETQLPDPAMEADQGVGTTVPHRGLAYVVFDDCPLADFGNRIPNFSFEVAWKRTPIQPIVPATWLPDSEFSTVSKELFAVSWTAGIYYTVDSTFPNNDYGIAAFDINTNRQISEGTLGQAIGIPIDGAFWGMGTGPSGFLYVAYMPYSGGMIIAKADPLTLTPVSVMPIQSGFLTPRGMIEIATIATPLAPPSYFLVTAPIFVGKPFCVYASPARMPITYLGGVNAPYDGDGNSGKNLIAPGYANTAYCEAWGMSVGFHVSGDHNSEPLYLYRLRVHANAVEFLAGGSPNIVLTDTDALATFSFVPADFTPYYGSPSPTRFLATTGSLVFDATPLWSGSPLERDTGHPMFFVTVAGAAAGAAGNPRSFLVKVNADSGEIMWAIPDLEPINYDQTAGQSRIENGIFAFPTGIATVTVVDTVNGVWLRDEDWLASSVEQGATNFGYGPEIYDTRRDAFITMGGSISPYVVLLNRGSGDGVPLSEIVQDVSLRAGYEAADLDVSELTDLVLGYAMGNVMSARSRIEPLAIAYQFDGVESDWIVKFRKRGRPADVLLYQDDLAVVNDDTGSVLVETRIPDKELPLRISVRYNEKDRDYEAGSQYAARRISPARTQFSERHLTHDVPVVFRALEVKERAERLLYEAWISRTHLTTKASWAFLKYDPLDVFQILLNDGTLFLARVVQADVGADWSIDYQLVTEDEAIYAESAVREAESGSGGGYIGTVVVQDTAPSRLLLIDTPLLLDTDDGGRLVSKLYVTAGSGPSLAPWAGAGIYQSSDGAAWAGAAQILEEPAWGAATTALAAPESAWVTDTTNTVTVTLAHGADQMESVSDLALLNGANPALLVNAATGDVEVFQYRDVVQVGANTFELSYLLRGRRGSDTMMDNHAAGDTFIIPTREAVSTINVPLSAFGAERYFRAVTNGSVIEAAITEPVTIHARDLMPYAPCQQETTVSGSDLVLSWRRRSRLGGEWLDGGESPPLAEDSEQYQIDIYSGVSVLRTLTASGTTSLTYTAAQIAADFGSMPAQLKFAVYQMSAQVGRGFAEVVTCDVPGRA